MDAQLDACLLPVAENMPMTSLDEKPLSHAEGRHSPKGYQPYLDGLRAIAVLSVFACHLELPGWHGGFVGVDVFFVISGYLISTIIITETAAGRFSLAAFYERRIRRIFPALFAMLTVLTIVGLVFFLPSELVAYARSLIAASLSGSNLYFYQRTGYFDQQQSFPLLHTWSLGVEEQFYIFFPLLVLTVRKWFPAKLRQAMFFCAAASLALSTFSVYYNRNAAFYMPQSRAWELLVGTLLSLKVLPPMRSAIVRNAMAAIGLAAVFASVHYYRASTPFPGLAALVPCLGTALMIESSRSGHSPVRRLLSWKPIRFIGRISYSLYLWHWPVIVLGGMGVLSVVVGPFFARRLPQGATSSLNTAIEVVLSFALSILSWRFIETPFRNGSILISRRRLFRVAAAATLATASASVVVILCAGFKERFSPQIDTLASYLGETRDMKSARMGVCFITTADHFENFNNKICLSQKPGTQNYLLLGDSHSAVIWPALSRTLADINVMQANTSGCAPVLHPPSGGDCKRMMEYVYQTYLRENQVDGLLLESRWHEADLPYLDESIAWAHAHRVRVVLLGPVPEYDTALPRLEAYSLMWNHPELVGDHRIRSVQLLDDRMAALAASKWHVPYVSLYRTVCPAESCAEYLDAAHTKPLLFDSNHLTAEAAQIVIAQLASRGALE